MIDAVYRDCGQKETVIFCDRIMGLGFYHAFKAGISFGKDDMLIPETKPKILEQTNELVREYEQQYNDGFITQLEKYNKVVDAWSKCTDQIAKEMMDRISAVHRDAERPHQADQLRLHDGPLRRARLREADAPARRHARPHDQAVRRDHRDADHLQLQGGPDRARVLQLDARRAQGPRRHGAQDGELGLPDAPPGRRGAGLHHQRGGLRHRRRHQRAGRGRRRPDHRLAGPTHSRPYRGRGCEGPGYQEGDRQVRRADRRSRRPTPSRRRRSRRCASARC